jgi:hypothetical protein
MFVWVAMTVVTVGWDYQGTEPPAVIAISLRSLSSIKHAQESLMTSGARIIYHSAIKNDSDSILRAGTASVIKTLR